MKSQLSIFKMFDYNKTPDKSIPAGIKLKRGEMWCPYCSNIVVFIRDSSSGVKRCPICEISIRDFWVKKVNRLL